MMFRKKTKKEAVKQEEPTFRARGDIQAEYASICAQIGDKEVKISFLQSDITILQARCRALNDEMNVLPKQEANDAAPENKQ